MDVKAVITQRQHAISQGSSSGFQQETSTVSLDRLQGI